MRRIIALMLGSMLCLSACALPSAAEEFAASRFGSVEGAALVNAGTEAYQKGNFEESASLYEAAVAKGISNGKLRYNLGNAYYRLNRFGAAIAAYRIALMDEPNEQAIRENLSLARKRIKEPVTVERATGTPLSPPQLFLLTFGLGRSQLKTLFAFSYLCFWVAFAGCGWKHRRNCVRCCTVAGISSLWIAVPLVLLNQDHFGNPVLKSPFAADRYGVVVTSSAEAYAGDSETFQVVAVIPEGAELLLGEQRKDWSEVLLPNGRKGWTKQTHLRVIES